MAAVGELLDIDGGRYNMTAPPKLCYCYIEVS